MIIKKMCLGCSKIDDIDTINWIEVFSGNDTSFYLCVECWEKKQKSKDLNISGVTN